MSNCAPPCTPVADKPHTICCFGCISHSVEVIIIHQLCVYTPLNKSYFARNWIRFLIIFQLKGCNSDSHHSARGFNVMKTERGDEHILA